MRLLSIVVTAACSMAAIGCGAGADDQERMTPGERARAQGSDTTVQSSTTDTDGDGTLDLYDDDPDHAERVRADAEPEGEFSSSCDIMLPEDVLSGDYSFVGAAKMQNTGNVGIVVNVRARFDQVASENVTDEKTVRIPVGKRRTAKFRIAATEAQIDEHQNSPDYLGSGDACKVSVKITSTFGRPPFED